MSTAQDDVVVMQQSISQVCAHIERVALSFGMHLEDIIQVYYVFMKYFHTVDFSAENLQKDGTSIYVVIGACFVVKERIVPSLGEDYFFQGDNARTLMDYCFDGHVEHLDVPVKLAMRMAQTIYNAIGKPRFLPKTPTTFINDPHVMNVHDFGSPEHHYRVQYLIQPICSDVYKTPVSVMYATEDIAYGVLFILFTAMGHQRIQTMVKDDLYKKMKTKFDEHAQAIETIVVAMKTYYETLDTA